MASATEDRETFYSPLPGNRAGSDDEDEVEPITPPPPPQYPRALELVRSVLREESTEDGFGSLNYDPFTSDASLCQTILAAKMLQTHLDEECPAGFLECSRCQQFVVRKRLTPGADGKVLRRLPYGVLHLRCSCTKLCVHLLRGS